MSLNKYMHPRNIYKTPPNFKQLAIDHPEFRPYVIQDVSGKVSIDFKNLESLRALTCTLLKKDFALNVEIPLTKMIPTVPLRLNYILWIEDLLSIAGEVGVVSGIDVGTGASCIYALLGARNGWKMLGTDVDENSLQWARQNVERNSLTDLIRLRKVSSDTLLKEVTVDEVFDFCMCNPPFFMSAQELNPLHKARRIDRPRPRNAFCATNNEVIVEGGELNFIQRMIEESKDLGKSVRIYTTMVGHKATLPQLKKLLRELDVISFKQTEFCQGHTTRWGLAWTFHDIDLRKVPEATLVSARKAKAKMHLLHMIKSKEFSEVTNKLKEVFEKLSISYEIVKESKNTINYCITASSNTWSHQRRKRRERERFNSVFERDQSGEDVQVTSDLIGNMSVHSPKGPTKRELEEEGFYNAKKIKMDTTGDYSDSYLKAFVNTKNEASGIAVEFVFIEGTAGREGLHQHRKMEFISTGQCEKYKEILDKIDEEYKRHEELEKHLENENQKLTAIQISNQNQLKNQIFRVVVKVYDSIFSCSFIYQDLIPQAELVLLQKCTDAKFFVVELTVSGTLLQKLNKQKFLLHVNIRNSLFNIHKTTSIFQKESLSVVVVPFDASSQPVTVNTSLYTRHGSTLYALYTSSTNVDVSYHFTTKQKEWNKDCFLKIARHHRPDLKGTLKNQSVNYKFKCKCATKHLFNSIVKNCYHRLDPETFVAFTNAQAPSLSTKFLTNDREVAIKLDKTENILTLTVDLCDLVRFKKYFINEIISQEVTVDKMWMVALKNLKEYLRAEFAERPLQWNHIRIIYQELRELIYDLPV